MKCDSTEVLKRKQQVAEENDKERLNYGKKIGYEKRSSGGTDVEAGGFVSN
jgi:hypothetical protein